ncbi:MAG: C1 family peptidase [Rhodospirillales bacterium]|nr:C1 family peptidase [Rhodospirillales bacterium]
MTQILLKDLASRHGLTGEEVDGLAQRNPASAADVYRCLANPALTVTGWSADRRSAVARALAWRIRRPHRQRTRLPPLRPHHGPRPEDDRSQPPPSLSHADQEAGTPCAPGALASEGRIALTLPSWPVKQQGARGTCVAFATTACCEFALAAAGEPAPNLSEQFLFWATKTKTADPNHDLDWSWLGYCAQAAEAEGICTEAEFRYDPDKLAQVAGPTPPAAVIAAARKTRFKTARYVYKPKGGAALVLSALKQGVPAAISLPVFKAPPPHEDGTTNWTASRAWAHGVVSTPPSDWVRAGGHSVCIVGFEPDPSEPLGGYFVCRNSWGTLFAMEAPSFGEPKVPQPGFALISATHVEACCWEFLQIGGVA